MPISRNNRRSCLEYSLPYIQSGFALVAKAATATQSAISAVFTLDMLNNLSGVLLIAVGMGWVLWVIEHRNDPKWTPGNSVYFAIVTLTTVGYGDMCPGTGLGKLVACFWMVTSVIATCVITSFVTAKLTVDSFDVKGIETLTDVKGKLCIESEYAVVQKFVNDSHFNWQQVVLARPNECFAGVLSGQFQAYMTDKVTLNWMVWSSINETSTLSVTPALNSNPLSIAFNAGSKLKQLIDFGIIELRANPAYSPEATRIYEKYFRGSVSSNYVRSVFKAEVDQPVVITASVFIFFTLLICIIESQLHRYPHLWRFLPRYVVKCLAGEAFDTVEEMSRKGGDAGFVQPEREIDEVRRELAAMAANAEESAARFRLLTKRLSYVASGAGECCDVAITPLAGNPKQTAAQAEELS